MEVENLEKAVRELGSKRIAFGSDWPYKPTNIEIDKMLYLGLSDDELEDVFWRNTEYLWQKKG